MQIRSVGIDLGKPACRNGSVGTQLLFSHGQQTGRRLSLMGIGSTPIFELRSCRPSIANHCHSPVTTVPEPVRFDSRGHLNP
jgi:hypothetical protein